MNKSHLRRWLDAPTITNPVERGQAAALQIMLLLIAGFGVLLVILLVAGMLVPASGEADIAFVLGSLGLVAALLLCVLGAMFLLRRGRFQAAVTLVAVAFTLLHNITVFSSALANSDVLLVYMLPLTLAGLLSSRRALPAVLALAVGGVWLTALTAPTAPLPSAGVLEAGAPSTLVGTAFNFTLITGIVGGFFFVFGNVLADALARALAREGELDELRRGLEQTIGERTADLRKALAEVEARAEAQAQLRREAEEQRALVRGMSVPVLPVSDGTLVVPLVGDLDTQRLADLQAQTLAAVERSGARRIVLDITGVPIVDTQVAKGLVQAVLALRLLGAEASLVGIRPEVAQTLVGLGVGLGDLATYRDLETALRARAARAR
jgi:rsbT co-antagonist protein RsbR